MPFKLPFNQIVLAAATLGLTISDLSAISFVVVTSQQTNSLNGDFNGAGARTCRNVTSPLGLLGAALVRRRR